MYANECASKGLFISFEGIDGSGKSSQARLLHGALEAHNPVLTREPGGVPGAEEIRALLLSGAGERWSPYTEILLFNAARRDHLEKLIWPALSEGRVVISDRFADSTRVYQGATREALRADVDALHKLMIGTEPDLTFVIDMDPQAALARAVDRNSEAADLAEDRFENMGLGFQQKLRAGFLALAESNADRVRLIDGQRSPELVAADILGHVMERLEHL